MFDNSNIQLLHRYISSSVIQSPTIFYLRFMLLHFIVVFGYS